MEPLRRTLGQRKSNKSVQNRERDENETNRPRFPRNVGPKELRPIKAWEIHPIKQLAER